MCPPWSNCFKIISGKDRFFSSSFCKIGGNASNRPKRNNVESARQISSSVPFTKSSRDESLVFDGMDAISIRPEWFPWLWPVPFATPFEATVGGIRVPPVKVISDIAELWNEGYAINLVESFRLRRSR